MCAVLCACSDTKGEVILIGDEEGQSVWGESTRSEEILEVSVSDNRVFKKNSREKSGCSDEVLEMSDTTEADTTIRVYVCGAVVSPGVVEIPVGSRVEAALEAADGFAENANRTYMNLAAWVSDGQMLYFPTQEESVETNQEIWSQVQMPGISDPNADETGLVNINTADVEKLCTLPGIGESRAVDIIAYREANGCFETCEDIMRVPGIKDGLFKKICNKITVE